MEYAIVYHSTYDGDYMEVVDRQTADLMPESWGILSWHATKAEAQAEMEGNHA